MNTAYSGFRSEEQPLTLDIEFLHEIHEGRETNSSAASTIVGSPASSIKLDVTPVSAPTPLPMAKFSILLMLNAIAPLAFELIYPFINAWVMFYNVSILFDNGF
jgi:hypothetical protein